MPWAAPFSSKSDSNTKPSRKEPTVVGRIDKIHTNLVYSMRGGVMRNVTVNISFQDELLAEIDAEAKRESRTRSELLREAARLYVRRQKQWERVFALGDELSKRRTLTETDVSAEIRNVRRRKT